MKCLVLAGGSGDALWPLSRRNYPKQFIHVNKGRSLFQEAIARNLPFCDEFYIVTNYKYENIVRGQMQVFQGLNYHIFLEEIGRQTAPAVMVVCLCMDPLEQVLVVSTDHRITDGNYNGTILKAQQVLDEKNVVAIGCRGKLTKGHNYFDVYDDGQVDYKSACKQAEEGCETCMGSSLPDRGVERFLDSGIFLVHAGTFVKAVQQNNVRLYDACCYGKNRMRMEGENAVLTGEWLETIPSVSVGEAVYEKWTKCGKVKVVPGDFEWLRLLSLEMLSEHVYAKEQGNDICHSCENVSIINEAKEKMIVANDLKDVLIVNTKDATYITGKGSSAEIKTILSEDKVFTPQQIASFDEGDIYYTTWGCKETLSRSEGYLVKKLTIFPGKSLSLHKHEKRSEHWSVVSGTATILLGGKEKQYHTNESIFVPMGVFHRISNDTLENLIVIEVSIGESVGKMADDLVQATAGQRPSVEMIKMVPACKDYLWGGERLAELYQYKACGEMIAESWGLSAHPAGCSLVKGGEYDGLPFDKYLREVGKEVLGWKCQPYERFPILVKFIDAKDKLSVQVHPDDDFALEHENEYGKNEMWYVVDCEEGAGIYCGFNRDVTKEEVRRRVEDNSILEILNWIPAKKGDVFFIKAGTVHAIGAGMLVCEIQQSSNCTYRLYDFDRRDKFGHRRELHLEKALSVLSYKKYEPADVRKTGSELSEAETGRVPGEFGQGGTLLGRCKYFESFLYRIFGEQIVAMDPNSFCSLICISGKGRIGATSVAAEEVEFAAGDSIFIPACEGRLQITGECEFILTHV